MTSTANLELMSNEEIVFEGGTGVLTNQRLLAWEKVRRGEGPADKVVPLSDITEYKRVIGGQDSRIRQGLMLVAAGAPLFALSAWLHNSLPELMELLFFTVGAIGIVLGLYLVLRSLLRVHPHTTVFFRITTGEDIPVSFPGRENPGADELIRRYTRAKSGLGL